MEFEGIAVLIILGVAAVFFAKEWLPVDIVAVLIIVTLLLTGILEAEDALSGFGHPAVIGVGALFIVSEALLRTGALGVVANRLEKWCLGRESLLLVLLLLIVAVSSAFLNNTPVVAMFIPVVLGVCMKMKFNPSHFLIPMSYAAILGGTCTLIGTSTNILVASVVEREGLIAPKMFDFTKLGVILTGAGLIYLFFFARKVIPDRQTITSMTSGADSAKMREYVTEIGVKDNGPLVGEKFADTPLAANKDVRVIQLIRGETILWPPFAEVRLVDGDALVIAGKIPDLLSLQAQEGIAGLADILADEAVDISSHETELAEILVLPNSPYIGKQLEDAQFRGSFGINVLAIQRHGMHLRKKLSEHPIRVGDLLLVQGTDDALHRLGAQEGLVLMTGVEDVMVRRDKARLAIGILACVILLLSFSPWQMATVALTGAVAMVLTGCLPVGKVYDSIHWRVLILIAGTLALGRAMETTGAAEWIASGLVDVCQHFGGPHLLVVVVLILAALLTECVSNTAVAAVLIPIALKIPAQLGHEHMSTMPFIMAVAYGASCSFLTPIGYQTNTLVYGAGGYKFTDFLRAGVPLVLIIWTLGGLLIPVFWPLGV
ncbi:MAG: SLC13 family permease [Planctomycetota bacterium]